MYHGSFIAWGYWGNESMIGDGSTPSCPAGIVFRGLMGMGSSAATSQFPSRNAYTVKANATDLFQYHGPILHYSFPKLAVVKEAYADKFRECSSECSRYPADF